VIARDGQLGKEMETIFPLLEWRRFAEENEQESPRIAICLPSCEHAERRDFFSLDCAPMRVVIAPLSAPLPGATGDHFLPHCRMPFALMSV
jgi:hypothetical protein